MFKTSGVIAVVGALVLGAACSSSGSGGREVRISQRDGGCTPASIDAKPGEKLNLVIQNDSKHDPYEMEGIEGTKFEELNVPEGRSRSAGYTVPDSGEVHKLKCYVPGGVSTILEVRTGGTAADAATATSGPAGGEPTSAVKTTVIKQPDTSVAVGLTSFSVTPDKSGVKAGTIRFIATNTSKTDVHELAVLRVGDDGSLDNAGEVEGIGPDASGSFTVDLKPGSYQLACLIAPGEAGSTVDHYQQGMHTDFKVE